MKREIPTSVVGATWMFLRSQTGGSWLSHPIRMSKSCGRPVDRICFRKQILGVSGTEKKWYLRLSWKIDEHLESLFIREDTCGFLHFFSMLRTCENKTRKVRPGPHLLSTWILGRHPKYLCWYSHWLAWIQAMWETRDRLIACDLGMVYTIHSTDLQNSPANLNLQISNMKSKWMTGKKNTHPRLLTRTRFHVDVAETPTGPRGLSSWQSLAMAQLHASWRKTLQLQGTSLDNGDQGSMSRGFPARKMWVPEQLESLWQFSWKIRKVDGNFGAPWIGKHLVCQLFGWLPQFFLSEQLVLALK